MPQNLNSLTTPQSLNSMTTPWAPLSERDVEIVQMIAEGATNREISEQMYLSPTTVKGLVARIMLRLGAKNRAHVAAIGVRSGWIE